MQLRWMDNLLCNTGYYASSMTRDASEMDPGDGLCRMSARLHVDAYITTRENGSRYSEGVVALAMDSERIAVGDSGPMDSGSRIKAVPPKASSTCYHAMSLLTRSSFLVSSGEPHQHSQGKHGWGAGGRRPAGYSGASHLHGKWYEHVDAGGPPVVWGRGPGFTPALPSHRCFAYVIAMMGSVQLPVSKAPQESTGVPQSTKSIDGGIVVVAGELDDGIDRIAVALATSCAKLLLCRCVK